MINLPKQLQNKNFNFVILERGGKKPIQPNWQNKEIKFDDKELIRHLQTDGNYGVRGGGKDNLVIIDFDNDRIQELVCRELPKTFTVKTGSGLYHKYFYSDKSESFKIFSEEMDTLADIQGAGKQVVAPESIHPNGKKYEIIEDSEIAFLPYAQIKAMLMKYDKKPKKEVIVKEEHPHKKNIGDDFLDLVKSRVTIPDVLSSFGINTGKNPTECCFHSSKGGACLGFNRDTAHCFHCDGSWNIFSFVKEAKNYDFKEALEYLSNLGGLQDELEKSRRKYLDAVRKKEKDELKELKNSFLDLIKDKKQNDATELLVNYLLENYYIYTTRDDKAEEVWIYKDGIYVPQGKSIIKEILRKILDKWYSAYNFNVVMNKIEADTQIDQDKFFNTTHNDEVLVKNGILNIFTRELKEFSPEKIFFNKMPVTYDKEAKCPKIEEFLKDVLSHEDDIDVLYELGGFSLMNDYKYEKAFMFIGDGRNGKDKTLELLKRIFGPENCCSVPLSSLVPDSFIISEFFNRKINLAGEIGNKDLKDTSTFKALTGRSLITAQRKFLNPVTFENAAKFVFACNELPMVYDNSRGFGDRWILLEFPYTFVPKDELEKNKDNKNLKLKDPSIIEKITTPEELSGLLNKFLDGLDRLSFNKVFSSTLGSEQIKELWIRKSNSVMAFCLDMVEEEYDMKISKKEFRNNYSKYCKKHKITAKSDYVIKRTLEEMFGAIEGTMDFNNKWIKCWEGIKWKCKL